jgi:sugar phosphate isomerase/epimerase
VRGLLISSRNVSSAGASPSQVNPIALSPCAAPPCYHPPMPSRLKIGIVAAALSPDPREAATRARPLGVAGIEFEAFASHVSLPELSQSGRREFRHVLSGQDLELIGLRADLGNKGLGPGADIDRAIARIEKAMEAAAGLAAPLVCVDLGPLPEPARVAAPKPKVDPAAAGLIIIPTAAELQAAAQPAPEVAADPAFESSVDSALAELGRLADRYSVILAFRSDLSSYAALDRAIAAADCPWFGVDLDPVAILRDRWTIDEIFSHVGPLVRHVRARDAVVGQDKRTKPAPVGRGSTNWEQLLSLLDDAGYSGWLVVDPVELNDRTAAARETVKHLTELPS